MKWLIFVFVKLCAEILLSEQWFCQQIFITRVRSKNFLADANFVHYRECAIAPTSS